MNTADGMYTKRTKTMMATKNVFKRVLGDLCTLVIFVKRPWPVTVRGLHLVLALSVVVLSGCASAQAKSKPADRPALMVPPPPPRVIEPAAELSPEPVADLPSAASSTRQGRSTPREASPKPPATESKPEAKAGEQKPIEPPPVEPSPQPVQPNPQLRTPQTADTSGAAKNVRATIGSARTMLNTVNYGPLNNERKKAYNDVKLFIQQAEDALKQENLVFAQGVATKAETLARELAGK
jgi:hypothetical protein